MSEYTPQMPVNLYPPVITNFFQVSIVDNEQVLFDFGYTGPDKSMIPSKTVVFARCQIHKKDLPGLKTLVDEACKKLQAP